ncbi:MAG: 5'-methylthioadenosine/S-adenosylhomocysteine nucleosidase [Thermocladium sp.]
MMSEKTGGMTPPKIAIMVLALAVIAAIMVAAQEYEIANTYGKTIEALELNGLVVKSVNGTELSLSTALALIKTPRIGIVTPMAMEEAPILAAMKVQAVAYIDGYAFYLGSINGRPVVLVRSGEKEYAAELATYLMDTHFHVVAAILSGTAGSRNPNVRVGDVVVGAFVVDKSSIHYHNRGFQSDYTGVEMVLNNFSLIGKSLITTYGEEGPMPQNASTYGYGPGTPSPNYAYIAVLPASLGLVQTAEAAANMLGNTSLIDATGLNVTGSIPARLIVGVIGSANQWTEPLSWMEAQNALYETDAGENEGFGFAYANAQLGVPWVIIRGISDTPWYPSTYHGVLAADRAALVVIYVITHFTELNLYNTTSFSDLSPLSNAAMHGYIVANRAYYNVTPVTEIQYTAINGSQVTINGSRGEYSYPQGIVIGYNASSDQLIYLAPSQ